VFFMEIAGVLAVGISRLLVRNAEKSGDAIAALGIGNTNTAPNVNLRNLPIKY
jgi:hypothetical protein